MDRNLFLISVAVTVSWDAVRYADSLTRRQTGKNDQFEGRLANRFPVDEENKGRFISVPCIIVDRNGVILCWFLPGALSSQRQVNNSVFIFIFYTIC
jgi:hypothetical protein